MYLYTYQTMMEVIDNIATSRGRYNDLALSADDSSISSHRSGRGSPNKKQSLEIDDDDISVHLEHELNRRSRKRICKFAAVGLVILLGLIAFISKVGSRSTVDSNVSQQVPEPEIGGETMINDDTGDMFGIVDSSSSKDQEEEIITVEEGIQDIIEAALLHAAEALPPFKICPPPMIHDRPDTQKDIAVFHISDFRIVPEDTSAKDIDDDVNDPWHYTLGDMDVSNDASIIALGLGDYSADTDLQEVGMVRVYAYSCDDRDWKRLGQDLVGEHEYEMYGHRVSSNRDGTVMAVSAPQGSYTEGNGFVEVYTIDMDDDIKSRMWTLLGSRIDALPNAESEYYMLGHAVDISDKGDTLAILGIIDDEYANPSYVTRVFDYDYRKKEWMRKGKDLIIKNVTFASYNEDYSPQVSLSEDGDRLIITDPQMGVVKYHFVFGFDKWKQLEVRTPNWNEDIDTTYWISSLDMDDRGDLIAYSAFEEDEDGTIVDSVKIVNFNDDDTKDGVPVDVYTRDFRGWSIDLSVSVSDQGNVAAFVASRLDVDDVNWWGEDFEYGDDIVGALTVLTKYEDDKDWSTVGAGTDSENLGVSGKYVYLSGDGSTLAVGYDTVVSLYGISLEKPESSIETPTVPTEQAVIAPEDTTAKVEACQPFQNGTLDESGALGYIKDLPQSKEGEEEQHTLSLSLSNDGSIVAVGIDSFDGEDRGMVRTFIWNCEKEEYVRLGKDLLGKHEFDGFGQSVSLSSSGSILAVGANQPPPGKSGYVDVYFLLDNEWELAHEIKQFPEGVSDIGRNVKLSDDGNTLMILGNIEDESDYASSYIQVLHNEKGKWSVLGDDIRNSVDYDERGVAAHASLSGDGTTIAVTGSYGQFYAKLYEFDKSESKWQETIVPPPSCGAEDDDVTEGDDGYLDYYYECYFSGDDISTNSIGSVVAIAGTSYASDGSEMATVQVLTRDPNTGNFTIGVELDHMTADYLVTSVDISDDAQHLVIGTNDHSDVLEDQGQSLSFMQSEEGGWESRGKVEGLASKDMLGSRVRITNDGRIAAASSRQGYISFFGA